ncbi:MAG: hypothetical protein KDE27_18105 [Planctomycetes bacterium]|nr:hypothetical protein [Planctomycetota bacterium]
MLPMEHGSEHGRIERVRRRGVGERFPDLYTELRSVADRVLGRHQSPSLAPSDLLHEAFFKLHAEEARSPAETASRVLGEQPDATFKACFGAACRDVLIDRLRRRGAQKRGGGQQHVEAHSRIFVPDDRERDALEIDDALNALAHVDADAARLVQARVFGGLTVAECAVLFGSSARTIDRRWAAAVEWLRARLG